MSTAEPLAVSPVPASIDNAGEWADFAAQIESAAGVPTQVTPDLLAGMIGSAAPLLFAADAAHNVNLLRGTFADPVIAQCGRNPGCLSGGRPTSVSAHLVGMHVADGHPVLRARLSIQVQGSSDDRRVDAQFWDLQLGAEVTVSPTTCPNCGAPLGQGELICGHCGTDARGDVAAPVVVTKLELY